LLYVAAKAIFDILKGYYGPNLLYSVLSEKAYHCITQHLLSLQTNKSSK